MTRKTALRFSTASALLALAGCSMTLDCQDSQAVWIAASTGDSAIESCAGHTNSRTAEALTLGQQYQTFREQLTALETQLAASGDDGEGGPRLEAVRLQREIQQIEGIARLRGWLPEQPSTQN